MPNPITINSATGPHPLAPGRYNRRMRREGALRYAAWYGAKGMAHAQSDAVADVLHTAPDGEDWTHWWKAYVSLQQRTVRAMGCLGWAP